MKDDPKSNDGGTTKQHSTASRKLRIKSSAKPPTPDPPETPCQIVID